jgi:hypothetical protein
MGDQDPSPFRESSFYDQETDQIADIDFIMASQEDGMAIIHVLSLHYASMASLADHHYKTHQGQRPLSCVVPT